MTPKQQSFIAEYLRDKNATQAAIRAGYSKKTAYSQGERLLRNVDVRSAIDAKLAAITEKAGLSAELVLASLVRELSFDPAKLLNEDGSMKALHEIDEDTRKCLVSIDAVQIGGDDSPVFIQKVRWINPSTAREQAMKHLGMFKEDNSQQKQEVITKISLVAVRPLPAKD